MVETEIVSSLLGSRRRNCWKLNCLIDKCLKYSPEVESRTQGQGQPFRGQTLSRPRTQAQVLPKKKRSSQKFFRRSPKKIFKALHKILTMQKYSAVLEPRTGKVLRTRGQGLDLQGQALQNVSSRTPPLVLTLTQLHQKIHIPKLH